MKQTTRKLESFDDLIEKLKGSQCFAEPYGEKVQIVVSRKKIDKIIISGVVVFRDGCPTKPSWFNDKLEELDKEIFSDNNITSATIQCVLPYSSIMLFGSKDRKLFFYPVEKYEFVKTEHFETIRIVPATLTIKNHKSPFEEIINFLDFVNNQFEVNNSWEDVEHFMVDNNERNIDNTVFSEVLGFTSFEFPMILGLNIISNNELLTFNWFDRSILENYMNTERKGEIKNVIVIDSAMCSSSWESNKKFFIGFPEIRYVGEHSHELFEMISEFTQKESINCTHMQSNATSTIESIKSMLMRKEQVNLFASDNFMKNVFDLKHRLKGYDALLLVPDDAEMLRRYIKGKSIRQFLPDNITHIPKKRSDAVRSKKKNGKSFRSPIYMM